MEGDATNRQLGQLQKTIITSKKREFVVVVLEKVLAASCIACSTAEYCMRWRGQRGHLLIHAQHTI